LFFIKLLIISDIADEEEKEVLIPYGEHLFSCFIALIKRTFIINSDLLLQKVKSFIIYLNVVQGTTSDFNVILCLERSMC